MTALVKAECVQRSFPCPSSNDLQVSAQQRFPSSSRRRRCRRIHSPYRAPRRSHRRHRSKSRWPQEAHLAAKESPPRCQQGPTIRKGTRRARTLLARRKRDAMRARIRVRFLHLALIHVVDVRLDAGSHTTSMHISLPNRETSNSHWQAASTPPHLSS